MSISVGAAEFSSSPTADLTLWVGDTDQPSNTDFILFLSFGREDTFAYLTGFARQDPETRPIGQLLLNLRFPHSYLSDVGLPSTIDPAATIATSSLPPIFGEIDGISMRSNGNYREWALFFLVNPEDMTVSVSGDIVRGNFTGVISGIEDRALYVPEPACCTIVAIVLCQAAFSQALKSRGRSRKRAPSATA